MRMRISHSLNKQQHLGSHPNSFSLALTAFKGSKPLVEEKMPGSYVRMEKMEALK